MTNSLETVSRDEMTDALARVMSSPGFDHGGRLGDFLTYVVEEEIAGRGEAIRGKTIAQDVYGRTPQDRGDPENIVRVDARRLRLHLDQYNATTGADDPVLIHIDPGSYRPRFEIAARPKIPGGLPSLRQVGPYVGLFVLGTLAGVGVSSILAPTFPQSDAIILGETEVTSFADASGSKAQRTAIYQKSPATLEAMTLAEQGHRMIFPIFDQPRQELLASVFERVVELDPDYFGGYAGLAHVLSLQSILEADPSRRDALVSRAQIAAGAALRISPTEQRTQTALALSEFAAGQYSEAMRLAQLAVELAPLDGQTQDFLGTIALFSGLFEEAIEAVGTDAQRTGSNQRFANRNIFAAASFHLGNYHDTYQTFEEAASSGDPLSAPSLAYQAAALVAAGRKSEAKAKLDQLNKAWPNAPLQSMLYGIHRDPKHADDVLDRLKAIGWQSN